MQIRNIRKEDKEKVIEMMTVFYASPAVSTNGSREIFDADVDECIHNGQYLEGFVFEDGDEIQGYAMIAKSFSTEFGKPCVWLEDIYIKEEYRGRGIAAEFFHFLFERHQNAVIRLEAEEENERAVKIYKKAGFEKMPYLEMIKFN